MALSDYMLDLYRATHYSRLLEWRNGRSHAAKSPSVTPLELRRHFVRRLRVAEAQTP